ncbi:hypothetical protein RCS94_06620 [Orbaceae bacterium ac157xtp]
MSDVPMVIEKLVPTAITDKEKFFLNEDNQIQPVVDEVVKYYKSLVIDGTTEDGRKELKKIGTEINKVIEHIDGHGKEIVDDLKAKPKKIDAGRKLIRDQLADLRTEIIKPLTDYEAEQKRIKEEAQAKIEAVRKAEQEELERLRAEKEQREREEKIKAEAVEAAKREAENKVREAELALQREREENKRKEREREAEIQRQKDEEERRLADVNHRKKLNNEALREFCNFGISEETAKDVIKLIIGGKIPHITINY